MEIISMNFFDKCKTICINVLGSDGGNIWRENRVAVDGA